MLTSQGFVKAEDLIIVRAITRVIALGVLFLNIRHYKFANKTIDLVKDNQRKFIVSFYNYKYLIPFYI